MTFDEWWETLHQKAIGRVAAKAAWDYQAARIEALEQKLVPEPRIMSVEDSLRRRIEELERYLAIFTARIEALEAENRGLKEDVLRPIANYLHHGGLLGDDAGRLARELSLPYWDKGECDALQQGGGE